MADEKKEPKAGSVVTVAKGEKVQAPDQKAEDKPFRPSDLAALIEKTAKENGQDPADVDPCRFLRENGLPVPTRRYRVAGQAGQAILEPGEYEAVDPSAAINAYVAERKPKSPHTIRYQTLTIAE